MNQEDSEQNEVDGMKKGADSIARFVSRAGQFLSWNRAVLNCVQETLPEKTCTRLTDTGASFLYKTTCTSFWHRFLEQV